MPLKAVTVEEIAARVEDVRLIINAWHSRAIYYFLCVLPDDAFF
jgi:hypothetical protein